jgi:alginate O-acetyltransferase complex protein AlgI
MFFNSIEFAIYLPLVFTIYWALSAKGIRIQNLFIVIASYIFYGWWDWRFLILIFFSTLTDFLIGLKLEKEQNSRNRLLLLWSSIIINLGLLGFFKYAGFFVENFRSAFTFFGFNFENQSLNIILPVGISFYTFQTLSYTIDVYKRRLVPTKDFTTFTAFVSFFPQLVAGPIERATHLLPQFSVKRTFSYNNAADGMRQILWGLFKKIVVADNCAQIANHVFDSSTSQNGIVLIIGAMAFGFQIYGDFSGYSDIAIGASKLFGIDIMRNFNVPYFSRDIAEFWRRWHISLTTWFRDYVYIPLGGSRVSKIKVLRNTLIIFLISGFWHGANWTFIAWGLYHALLFIPHIILNKKSSYPIATGNKLPSFYELIQISTTFMIVTLGWIFFRSENIQQAFSYFSGIFNFDKNYFDISSIQVGQTALSNYNYLFAMISVFVLILVEWINRNKSHGLDIAPLKLRWLIYIILTISIFVLKGGESAFIYFQF